MIDHDVQPGYGSARFDDPPRTAHAPGTFAASDHVVGAGELIDAAGVIGGTGLAGRITLLDQVGRGMRFDDVVAVLPAFDSPLADEEPVT